jgi:glycosyltransferase involved in cell wall biosynthesis
MSSLAPPAGPPATIGSPQRRGTDGPAIAYMLRMFPQTSETFVANELLALERLGLRLRVFSYRQPRTTVLHRYFDDIAAPVTYLPDPLNRNIRPLFASARAMHRREPDRFRRTLSYVARHSLRSRSIDTWRRLLQACAFAEHLHGADISHLHAHFAHGATRVTMLASMLTGIPYSFTAHAADIFSHTVDRSLLREKAAGAQFVVTVSNYNRRFLTEQAGLPEPKVRVVYNGVDLERFAPDGSPRDPRLILGVGRFVEKKGFPHLVEALARLRDSGRDLRCELAGGGPEHPQIVAAVRRAGLEDVVSFAGSQPQEALPASYRRAAVFAMPAIEARDGNRDALPTVLLEAMACGTPVVSSRLAGIPEIIDDGVDGFLVEPGNVSALAAAIARVLDDALLGARLGAAAREKVQRTFDVDTNAQALAGLFAQSLSAGVVAR